MLCREPSDGRRESPGYVQVSLAAAMVLGLRPGRFHRGAATRCLNLLLTYGEGCLARCAYCGLARDREGASPEKRFIRVEWPVVSLEEVVQRSRARTDALERMCIAMVTHKRAEEDTKAVLERWVREKALGSIPVSILSNPTTMRREDLLDLKRLGAQRFTVALDAATPGLFEATRGRGVRSPHRWETYWSVLEEAAGIFGRHAIGVHLICGLGETEQEMAETMQRVRDMGAYGAVHLFAFNPEEGSRMEHRPRVPLGQFRRVQLARYLMEKDLTRYERMGFNARGQIVDFGVDAAVLDRVVATGLPFRTSGCPGREAEVSACNRPYGDGPPTDFSSFPFPLNRRDVAMVREQLRDYEGRVDRRRLAQAELEALERAAEPGWMQGPGEGGDILPPASPSERGCP